MATVKGSILIHAALDKVFATAKDPHRWHNWFVGLSEPEEITGGGGVGTVVKSSYLLAGMQFPVATRVLEAQADAEGARWKGKIEGPFDGEQTWIYTPKDGDTEVAVDVTYTLPGAALGRIANRLILERMMASSLEQTLKNLKMILEAE